MDVKKGCIYYDPMRGDSVKVKDFTLDEIHLELIDDPLKIWAKTSCYNYHPNNFFKDYIYCKKRNTKLWRTINE